MGKRLRALEPRNRLPDIKPNRELLPEATNAASRTGGAVSPGEKSAVTLLLNQLLLLSSLPTNPAARRLCVEGIIELFRGLQPRGPGEIMLAGQMVALHQRGMEFLLRAAEPHRSIEEQAHYCREAHKMLSLYLRQWDALQRHRGGASVNVGTLNVAGDAVVGSVVAAGSPPRLPDERSSLQKIGDDWCDQLEETEAITQQGRRA